MTDEQGKRLNKLLKVSGYIISGAIVWFYITKGIVSLLPPTKADGDIIGAYMVVGIGWTILAGIMVQTFYYLYTWVSTGKGKNLVDLIP